MLVELGGGTRPHPSVSVGIDLHHPVNAPPQDATVTPWRLLAGVLPDECADEVFASHFMEHVPHGKPLIDVMNEAWRVLKPGGAFTMQLPLVGWTDPVTAEGHAVRGWQPYADPTHVSFWWFPEALLYFCDGPFKPNAHYGIREWAMLGGFDPAEPASGTWWHVRHGWEGVARLVKPMR